MRLVSAFKLYRPSHGGVIRVMEVIIRGIRDRQAAKKQEVLVCSEGLRGEVAEMDGATVRRAGSFGTVASLPIAPTYPFLLHRSARQASLLAVHAPFPLADLTAAAGLLGDCPTVIHWHSDIVQQRRLRPLVAPFVRRSLDRCRRIVVMHPRLPERSEALADFRDRCEVIPFGVPDQAPAGGDDGDFLYVGRLVPYKGVDVLVRAMADVPSARLRIIGDGPLRGRLEALVDSLGLRDRIRFLGEVDHDSLNQELAACLALVLPSVSEAEAFGIVQLEAMAFGRPVINTALDTGVPWVARHELEALTVEPVDAAALAAAMRRLSDDAVLRRELGAAAMERQRAAFNEAAFVDAVIELYRDVARD